MILAEAIPDFVSQLGATGGVGGLVIWLLIRVSKLETRISRIEGAVCGEVGDTEHVQRPKRRRTACLLFLPLAIAGAGCSTVRIEDTQRGIAFSARVPAWPWQDSTRTIDRVTIAARGTNFNASLRGLAESETTTTNIAVNLDAATRLIQSLR